MTRQLLNVNLCGPSFYCTKLGGIPAWFGWFGMVLAANCGLLACIYIPYLQFMMSEHADPVHAALLDAYHDSWFLVFEIG